MGIRTKYFQLVILTVLVAIVGGELFARYYLGLGTPPLSITHKSIEYMFKPGQDVYRFGNHIIINEYGMRTEPFAARAATGELRIMVFGDSVLNGGSQTDHAALSTTILQKRLAETAGNVVVGNISAGSWGPGNWLAYAKEYGFFDANVVALVVSSHDYADNPTFQSLSENTHPTERPVSALLEGITRYLPRYLPQSSTSGVHGESARFSESSAQEVVKGLKDLEDFLVFAKNSSKYILVFQHWEREEIESGPKPGNQQIRELSESLGIATVSLEQYFRRSKERGRNPYRDNIHPNQIGQQLIAEALWENLPEDVR